MTFAIYVREREDGDYSFRFFRGNIPVTIAMKVSSKELEEMIRIAMIRIKYHPDYGPEYRKEVENG